MLTDRDWPQSLLEVLAHLTRSQLALMPFGTRSPSSWPNGFCVPDPVYLEGGLPDAAPGGLARRLPEGQPQPQVPIRPQSVSCDQEGMYDSMDGPNGSRSPVFV